MTKRGFYGKSQYVYNSQTGRLEKKEKNVITIQSLKNKKNKDVKDISEIVQISNEKNRTPKPISNITVITSEDNLIHNYFYDFDVSWGAHNCLSVATIKMPKTDKKNIQYWANYQGTVTVYAGYNFKIDKVNKNTHATEEEASHSLVKYGENADIKPFFRGTVNDIKEYQNYITVYINSIGVRFKQKIPEEFRQKYINGQNVNDAFKAICEFLGVQYICPPKKINETSEDANVTNNNEGDGTENDVTQQQEIEQNIVNIAKNKAQQTINNVESNDTQQTDNQLDVKNNTEIDIQLNGYDDISFDSNGAIIHGSAAIEDSPDITETLLNIEDNPLERYLEDETGVIEKVQKFLDGDMFEELHNNVMNYGAITIEPSSTNSSEMSVDSMGNTNVSNLSNNTNSSSNSSSGSSSSSSSSSSSKGATKSLQARDRNGWINGQQYINGKIHLSNDYINSLTPSQAWAKYIRGGNTYTAGTLNKLRARGYWQPII